MTLNFVTLKVFPKKLVFFLQTVKTSCLPRRQGQRVKIYVVLTMSKCAELLLNVKSPNFKGQKIPSDYKQMGS